MCYVNVYAAQHYTDPNLEQSGTIWNNLEQSGRSERKFRIFLKFYFGFNCLCSSEVPQEYYCVYSHLNFVSVELTSLVFHL